MKTTLPFPFVRMACAFAQGVTAAHPSIYGLALRGMGRQWSLSAMNGNAIIEIRWASDVDCGGYARGLNVPAALLKVVSPFTFDTETGVCETRDATDITASVNLYLGHDEAYDTPSGLALQYTGRALSMFEGVTEPTWDAETCVPMHIWEKLDTKKHGFARWLGKRDLFGQSCKLTRMVSSLPTPEWPILVTFPHHSRPDETAGGEYDFDIRVLFMPLVTAVTHYDEDDLQ